MSCHASNYTLIHTTIIIIIDDHQSSEELETHMSNGSIQDNVKTNTSSNNLTPLKDEDQGTDSTINLLVGDPEIRRSSTFGLLEEEKQGIYKLDTCPDDSVSEDTTGVNSRTDLLNQTNDIVPEVADREERIELTGFSLKVTLDTVPSAVSLITPTSDEQLKSKSMSHIEESKCLNGDGQLVKWHSEAAGSQVLNSFEGTLNPKLTKVDDKSSCESLSDYDYFNISSLGIEEAVRKSMEDLLNQQSSTSSHNLDNELQSSKSKEDMFY